MAHLPRFDLKDQVVMVTGAAGGIGSEIVRACAEAGADVVLTDRDIPQLAEVAAQVKAGRRAECLPFDLLDVQAIREGAAEAFRRMGRIDGLVNCAGTNVYQLALEVPEEEWDLIVGVNLKGLFFLSQAVAREMVERKQNRKHRFHKWAERGRPPLRLLCLKGRGDTTDQGHGDRARSAWHQRQCRGPHLYGYADQPGDARGPGAQGADTEFHTGRQAG
jgi:NAD(P)-dependent dehydrogenase (short-subunit alcohol dehydrogenase family)